MIFFRRGYPFDPNWEMTARLRWLIWTSGWRGALVLFTLLITGWAWWKGAEGYERLKVWRGECLIAESAEARELGDYTKADGKLRQAVALLQHHPTTLRAVAHHQLAIHDLTALTTYAELMKTGGASEDDKIAFCRQAFRLGRSEVAASTLQELNKLPDRKDSAAVLSLLAEQSAREGNSIEAVKLARRSCATASDSDQDVAYSKAVLARLLLQPSASSQSGAYASAVEGVDVLIALSLREDETGQESLQMLVNLAQSPQTSTYFLHRDVKALITAAARNPQADAALRVGAWSLLLAAEPAKHGEICREFFDAFHEESSLTVRLEAARWLNRKGMHKETLEMVGPSKLESSEWLFLYLDATAALGRWEDVLTTLTAEQQSVPLPPAIRKLFEFRCAVETGRHPDVAASWREIQIALRSEKADDQLYVAGYAEQIGLPAEAAQAYRRLLSAESEMTPAREKLGRTRRLACYLGVLRTEATTMTLNDLREFMGSFAEEFPEMDEVQNDHAYLQLLAGQNLEMAAATARRLAEKKPELLAFRTTQALAALRRKEIKAAVAVYDGWKVDWSTAQDRYKAVYVAVMRASGRPIEANIVASTINKKTLRFEERQLADPR